MVQVKKTYTNLDYLTIKRLSRSEYCWIISETKSILLV